MNNSELTTRILAVALALFLWAYVRMVHESPDAQRVIENIPVVLVGKLPAGLQTQVHIKDRLITVRLKGPAQRVNNVLGDEVHAKVDVTSVTHVGTMRLPANIELPRGVVLAQKPPDITVEVTALAQERFPVTVTFITTPPPGTAVGEYLIQPSTVTVEGLKEAVDEVRYVTVAVDPSETMRIKRLLVPHARNADGDLVPDVQVLVPSVEVSVASLTGQQVTREVAVRPPDLRNPPRQFTVTVVKMRPDVVTLSGESALLDKQPAYLETEPLDVHGVTHDTTVTAHLKVPHGLTIVEGYDVRVDLQAHPIVP